MYNFRIGVIRSMLTHGYEVYVLAPRDAYTEKIIATGAHFLPIPLDNYSTNPWSDTKLCYHLWRLYREHRFDTIFHYTIKPNIFGSIAAYMARVPHRIAITTGLGRMFRFDSQVTNGIVTRLYRLAARCADEVWFLNESDRDKFVKEAIAPQYKCQLLPSEGVNTSKYRPLREPKKTKITRLLYAGRLLGEKGIYQFVEAARIIRQRHKHVRFEILGYVNEDNRDSVTLDELMTWQREGIIKYLGSTEDVRPYIDRSVAVVLPSFYQEGISRILLEAISMATPVITTDQVGCREVVIDGHNGFLCTPKSTPALVEAIERLLSLSWERRMAMGQRGRAMAKDEYSEERIIRHYLRALDHTQMDVLESKSNR